MVNVEEIQEMIKDLYNYEENKEQYDFFYDETNNYRKIKITEKGFNNNKMLTDNFTLGGICIKKGSKINIDELSNKLKLQKNQFYNRVDF